MNRSTFLTHQPLYFAIACILIGLCTADAAAQTRARWKSHDVTRPHPPVVTPAAQKSPVPPPSDAIVLFDGTDLSKWCGEDGTDPTWIVEEGAMRPSGKGEDLFSVRPFGDVQLHLEWASPLPARGSSQGRGNSGVFFMGLYEVQILDSFENETYADGQAAALYGQTPPLVNACLPPGEWQTYDIVFRRPRFGPGGACTEPVRLTVFHNGVLVQDSVPLCGGTMWLQPLPYAFHPDKLPLSLQDHGNPVKYRNIWVRELREEAAPGPDRTESEPVIALSAEQLERYVGVYKSSPDAKSSFDIFSDGRQIHCLFGKHSRDLSGRQRGRVDLVPNSPTRFSMRWAAAHVEFTLPEEGPATALSIHVGGGSFTVKRME